MGREEEEEEEEEEVSLACSESDADDLDLLGGAPVPLPFPFPLPPGTSHLGIRSTRLTLDGVVETVTFPSAAGALELRAGVAGNSEEEGGAEGEEEELSSFSPSPSSLKAEKLETL